MIIAVDFDGTIVEHKYPKIGKEIPFAVETLKRLQADHHTLILWSVREGQLLKDAVPPPARSIFPPQTAAPSGAG